MLSAHSILSDLPVETVAAGTVLLRRGQSMKAAIFADSGTVALGIIGPDNRIGEVERQLDTVQGPCWLEAPATILDASCPTDAVAQTDVSLRRLPIEQFKAFIRGSAPGVLAMLTDMARANYQQTERTVQRMAKDAESRCAEWLLRNAETTDKGEHVVHLRQYKRAIAAQLGIVPETLSRALRELRELHLISGKGKQVHILNPAEMRKLAGQTGKRPN